MKEQILAAALGVLNSAIGCDKDAMHALVETRVPCNDLLADHTSICVTESAEGGGCEVGLLGVLNGILEPLTEERIAAVYTADGKLAQFIIYQRP